MSALTHRILRVRREQRPPYRPTYEERWELLERQVRLERAREAWVEWFGPALELSDPFETMGPLLHVPEFVPPEEPLFLRMQRFDDNVTHFVNKVVEGFDKLGDAMDRAALAFLPYRDDKYWALPPSEGP